MHRGAVACPNLLESCGVWLVERDAVIVRELFALADSAPGFDYYLIAFGILARVLDHPRLAVRLAAMIDPARDVAAVVGVNDICLVKCEKEGVTTIRVIAIAGIGLIMREYLSSQASHAGIFSDVAGSKNTVSMNE